MLCLGVNDMSREMKDSGVEWIGEIPKDWNVQRVKNAFVRKKAEAHQENPVVLSLARAGVKVRDLSKNEGQIAESYYNYNPVEFGDLLLNPMDLYSGANCSISMVEGVISPAYINLRAKSGYSSRFYDYYFKTQYWSMAMFAHGKGVSFENRWTLGIEEVFNYKIPVPLEDEQDKIAVFLDKRCEKIDQLIQKQQEYCELLNQYKYSLYTEKAKKLNCKRTVLGRIVKNIEQGWSPAPAERNEDGNWNVLTLAAVKYGEFTANETKCFNGSIEKCGNLSLKKGDFLLTRSNTRELVGQVCIVDEDMEKTIFSDLIYRITFDRRYVEPEYLKYYFQTAMMRQQISRDAHGSSSTMVKITHKDIKMWEVELPALVEQKKYINEMKKKTAIINKLLNNHNQYTELLKDYKKSLIYEYVTGKKEVPES